MTIHEPAAIIDIGSNSVRLVVYAGPARIPAPIFNEKVLAGLGRGLGETGRLPAKGRDRALAALARFRLLVDAMGVGEVQVLATAAVRDAEDGPAFVRAVNALGFQCRVLSAAQEAELAGQGVLSGIPGADGIAGDLGGGSVEFVDIADDRTSGGISLPLGVLRLDPAQEKETGALLGEALGRSGLAERGRGRPFYLVGGSWRALARIEMADSGYPLPIVHQHVMDPGRVRDLRRLLAHPDSTALAALGGARRATAPAAAMLLDLIVQILKPSQLVFSSFGIREGLLFAALPPRQRRLDPLVAAARDVGGGAHGFGELGDKLDQWLAPMFADPPERARLRHAACLLADAAWPANPAFRADRAIELALHGNWVGIDAPGRVMVAYALAASFGHDVLPAPKISQLCSDKMLKRAHEWGLAIRLGQRLSGGVGTILDQSRLSLDGDKLKLRLQSGHGALAGERVGRGLGRLAEALGKLPEVEAS